MSQKTQTTTHKPRFVGFDPQHLPRQRPTAPPPLQQPVEDMPLYVSMRETKGAYAKLAAVVVWRGLHLSARLVLYALSVLSARLQLSGLRLSDELRRQRQLSAKKRQWRQWSREAADDNYGRRTGATPGRSRHITITTKVDIHE